MTDDKVDAAIVRDFVNDLKGMTDDTINREIDDVSDVVDRETSWLEALTAERRMRSRKRDTIKLTRHEVQSGLTRVKHAELLIAQLSPDHDGRNTWLLNYGISDEARLLRQIHKVSWIRETEAAETK